MSIYIGLRTDKPDVSQTNSVNYISSNDQGQTRRSANYAARFGTVRLALRVHFERSDHQAPAAEHTAFAIAFETVSRSGSPNPAARAARHPAPGLTDASAVQRPVACGRTAGPPAAGKCRLNFLYSALSF